MFVQKITAFFLAISAFFSALFGGNIKIYKNDYVKLNVMYGTHERNVYDLYVPKNAEGDTGLILFIHGGGWIAGSKDSYKNELISWAERGYACAALSYRYVSDEYHMDDILDDITACLTSIKAFGYQKGINFNKVLLTGASAGGHLSQLYAYSRYEEAPVKPAAVVSLCGPVDLTNPELVYGTEFKGSDLGTAERICELLSDCCGIDFKPGEEAKAKDALLEISPVTYLNEKCVPTVICHGICDTVVPYSDAVTLDRMLTQYGVRHDLVSFPNSNHGLESDPDCTERMNELFIEYAETYLK